MYKFELATCRQHALSMTDCYLLCRRQLVRTSVSDQPIFIPISLLVGFVGLLICMHNNLLYKMHKVIIVHSLVQLL